MGNFSRPPLEVLQSNLQRGFVGLHVEQGVPVLDRDLNLLQDLITAQVRKVIATYIGNGIAPDADAFAIGTVAGDNDFAIGAGPGGAAGTCLVNGLEVTIAAPTTYTTQPKASGETLPPLTTPPAGTGTRIDTVFLDLFLEEVQDGVDHPDLANGDDVGMRTSVRLRPGWRVRVAQGVVELGKPPLGHFHYVLARLNRPAGDPKITSTMLEDLRQQRLNVATMERRLRVMEELLTLPRFSTGTTALERPINRPNGRPGERVQLRGHNLRVSEPQVFLADRKVTDLVMGRNEVTGLDTIDGTIPSVDTFNQDVFFRVVTAGGSATCPVPFRVLEPEEPAQPPAEFSTGTTAPTRPFSRPSGRPGETLQLRGKNFLPVVEVLFGTNPPTSGAITASGQLTTELQFVDVTVPNVPPATVSVSLRTSAGTQAAPQQFQILAP